jgi:abortive infection bacteriophage resistance protein
MRFHVGHLLGKKGPFAHTDPALLDSKWATNHSHPSNNPNCTASCTWNESDHGQWIRKQNNSEKVSSEAFAAHIYSNYGDPLPLWAATEVMSMGQLNRLFGGMTQRDRQQIAVNFDVVLENGDGDASAVTSWLEHLRQTRNYCAHHSRLWNRNHTAPLSVPVHIPELQHLQGARNEKNQSQDISRGSSRIYGTFVLISYLLARIDSSNNCRDKLRELIEGFAKGDPQQLPAMGFPAGWRDEAIWQVGYQRDTDAIHRSSMLRNVDLLYTADAASLLKKGADLKASKSLLTYYRREGALLSVPGTEAHRHPSFQFDVATGDLYPIAILANRRLLNGSLGSDAERWEALKWWTTSVTQLGDMSPQVALTNSTLSKSLLDQILTPREDE